MEGIFSRSFCVTATRTVITEAAGPLSLIFTIGSSMSMSSRTPPPVPARYGRISSKTASTFSSFRSSPVSVSITCSTSMISGIFSISRRSMPMRIVTVLLGHDPHAPMSLSRTTSPSISISSTLPPSEIKYGRTWSRTSSTLSPVSSKVSVADSAAPAAARTSPRLAAREGCLVLAEAREEEHNSCLLEMVEDEEEEEEEEQEGAWRVL
mmetsp:Transcript_43060/g.69247  ORF Transcript_43060/g.69247 Transcript_43060/m.69247 type:complete len:209 (-) Transcript_43060:208-834(-)